jgi:hypothetical protein
VYINVPIFFNYLTQESACLCCRPRIFHDYAFLCITHVLCIGVCPFVLFLCELYEKFSKCNSVMSIWKICLSSCRDNIIEAQLFCVIINVMFFCNIRSATILLLKCQTIILGCQSRLSYLSVNNLLRTSDVRKSSLKMFLDYIV